jgi:Protein of unknown function (DUF1552)
MKIVDLDSVPRRRFLRGAAGATLALPFLPSLLPRALAQGTPIFRGPKRFIAMATNHGGVAFNNMYPTDAVANSVTQLFPGHNIRSGKLTRTVNGNTASVSPVLTASATALNQRIVDRMNVVRGLDVPFYLGHNTGRHLGNFARNNSEDFNDINKVLGLPYKPTVDQLMAWSPAFYPNLSGIKSRAIVTGNYGGNRGMSFKWSNPQGHTGSVDPVATEPSAFKLFDTLIGSAPKDPTAGPTRPLIVDRILENYRRLRNGNARLSVDDRRRLDTHLERVMELERRIHVTVKASCADFKRPPMDNWIPRYEGSGPEQAGPFFRILNEVIAAALICDTSRVVTMGVDRNFTTYASSWHQDIAHNSHQPSAQALMVQGQRTTFESVFLDLANRIDVEDAPGVSMLDNTLMQWTQECGAWTHDSDSIPLVTIGGAGGFLKTGQFLDLRNTTTPMQFRGEGGALEPGRYSGITYNRWLATALQAMGVPNNEWETPGQPGYGSTYRDAGAFRYVTGVLENASKPMPIIT